MQSLIHRFHPSKGSGQAGKDKQKEKSFAATCDGALFLFIPTPVTIT